MTDLEKLLAIHEIHGLKARYFRFVDTKDWDGLRTLFTRDALIHYPEAWDPLESTCRHASLSIL